MTDIVERLRAFVAGDAMLAEETIGEAADEIERLRSLADSLGQDNERFIREIERLTAEASYWKSMVPPDVVRNFPFRKSDAEAMKR